MAEAIGRGGPLNALIARLADRQARRVALEGELSLGAAQRVCVNPEGLEQRLRAKLADWRGLLRRNVAEGRAVLRTLLIGPLRFTPIVEERRRGCAFEGVDPGRELVTILMTQSSPPNPDDLRRRFKIIVEGAGPRLGSATSRRECVLRPLFPPVSLCSSEAGADRRR